MLRTTASLDAAILPEACSRLFATSRGAAAVAIDRPPVHDTTYDAIFVPDDEYVEDDDDDVLCVHARARCRAC